MKIKMNLYALKDLLADDFGPVFEAKNDEVAKRYRQNTLDKNPSVKMNELAVYHLGYVQEDGSIVGGEPRMVGLTLPTEANSCEIGGE